MNLTKLQSTRVTVMGLGLNGGGLASARFFAERGARVTVTDMKDELALAESVAALADLPMRFVLGRHDAEDFSTADIVIKNPAVRPDNPFLRLARRVETDLSVFLSLCPCPIAAVTGSKGKSTTAAALAWLLQNSGRDTHLGGNITLSPLSFLNALRQDSLVVLELSSWQLGDLKGRGLLRPRVAALTKIVPDHLDRYGTMEAYVADKRLIYADQTQDDYTVYGNDDPYGLSFAAETKAQTLAYGSRLPEGAYGIQIEGAPFARLPGLGAVDMLPEKLLLQGAHNRYNMAAAALCAWALGAAPESIRQAAGTFRGIEHRLEPVRERNGVVWYNDSAATVPEAVAAACASFTAPIVLLTGGTDKQLDFETARPAYAKAAAIVLLEGTGSEKIKALLDEDGIPYHGMYGNIVSAVQKAAELANPNSVVVFSPGCTSFGMFKNEFDRGRRYKEAVNNI